MVLHEGRDLGGPLALVVHGAVNLHVFVQEAQKLLLALNETEAMAALFWRSRVRVRRGEAAVRGSVLGAIRGYSLGAILGTHKDLQVALLDLPNPRISMNLTPRGCAVLWSSDNSSTHPHPPIVASTLNIRHHPPCLPAHPSVHTFTIPHHPPTLPSLPPLIVCPPPTPATIHRPTTHLSIHKSTYQSLPSFFLPWIQSSTHPSLHPPMPPSTPS